MTNKESAVKVSKEMLYGIVIVFLTALLVVSVMTQGFGLSPSVSNNQTQSVKLSDAELKSKAQSYINTNLLASDYTSEATGIKPYDSYLSEVTINIKQGTTVLETTEVYISNDGSTIFVGKLFQLNASVPTTNTSTTQTNVSQTAKPKAQVFVMAFCPYGLQFLKAYIPVMELLGNSSDLEVNFVDYAMHGKTEVDGNSYLYCVQKEEKTKFTNYLRCFVEEGDYQGCVATAGIEQSKIDVCVAQLDTQYNLTGLFNDQSTWVSGYYPQYPVEAALNTQYGVQGSPTFILNGQKVSVSRSAESIKQAVCNAFTQAPAECSTTLRTATEAPGLGSVGSGTTSSPSSAECG
ncbi:MAG: hypothetical protein ABH842_04885 [Candidatus Micrarchaeota archaeon]